MLLLWSILGVCLGLTGSSIRTGIRDHGGHGAHNRFLCYGWCYVRCDQMSNGEDCPDVCKKMMADMSSCKGIMNCFDTCRSAMGNYFNDTVPENNGTALVSLSETILMPVYYLLAETEKSDVNKLDISWGELPNITGYIVQYRDRNGLGGSTTWKAVAKLIRSPYYQFEKPQLCGMYAFRVAGIGPAGYTRWSEIAENSEPDVKWDKAKEVVSVKSMESINNGAKVLLVISYEPPMGWDPKDVEPSLQYMAVENCKFPNMESHEIVNKSSATMEYRVRYDEHCKAAILYEGVRTVCGNRLYHISPRNGNVVSIAQNDCSKIKGLKCGTQDSCSYTSACNLIRINATLIDEETCSNTTDVLVEFQNDPLVEKTFSDCEALYYMVRYGLATPDRSVPNFDLVGDFRKELNKFNISTENNSVYLENVPRDQGLVVVQICSIFKEMNASELEEDFNLATASKLPLDICPPVAEPIVGAATGLSPGKLAMTVGLPLTLGLVIIIIIFAVVYRRTRKEVRVMRAMKSSIINGRYVDLVMPELQDKWEIDRRRLIVYEEETLGKGAFGKVYKGKVLGRVITAQTAKSAITNVQENADDMIVAVKQCYEFADESTKKDFLQEIALMKSLYYHSRLVNILHCISVNEPLSLIVEYCANGDLLHFLRSRRNYMTKLSEDGIDLSDPSVQADLDQSMMIRLKDVIQMSFQVSDGMEYISQKGFVHRDIAARNILVDENFHLKIGDFGLTRFVHTETAYMSRGGKLPIKWMALEAIERYEFTTKSDVWSFGVLLFEIITLGGAPYPDIMPLDGDFRQAMLTSLLKGERMEQPEKCPDELYEIMLATWRADADQRPDFTVIKEDVRKLLEIISSVEDSEGQNYHDGFYVNPLQSYYTVAHPDDFITADSVDIVDEMSDGEVSNKESPMFDTSSSFKSQKSNSRSPEGPTALESSNQVAANLENFISGTTKPEMSDNTSLRSHDSGLAEDAGNPSPRVHEISPRDSEQDLSSRSRQDRNSLVIKSEEMSRSGVGRRTAPSKLWLGNMSSGATDLSLDSGCSSSGYYPLSNPRHSSENRSHSPKYPPSPNSQSPRKSYPFQSADKVQSNYPVPLRDALAAGACRAPSSVSGVSVRTTVTSCDSVDMEADPLGSDAHASQPVFSPIFETPSFIVENSDIPRDFNSSKNCDNLEKTISVKQSEHTLSNALSDQEKNPSAVMRRRVFNFPSKAVDETSLLPEVTELSGSGTPTSNKSLELFDDTSSGKVASEDIVPECVANSETLHLPNKTLGLSEKNTANVENQLPNISSGENSTSDSATKSAEFTNDLTKNAYSGTIPDVGVDKVVPEVGIEMRRSTIHASDEEVEEV